MSDLTLVIMAAGAGRRYGGLKQLAPVGPTGEAIMEYSIHDALKSGFSKIVLVIRSEHESEFDDKFGQSLARQANLVYAFQEMETLVPPEKQPVDRPKPWGTAHAVLSARDEVTGPFAVINADDFYGPSAFASMGEYLAGVSDTSPMQGAMVGYKLRNTLSDHGSVSRGVCERDASGHLASIVERHKIVRSGDDALLTDAEGNEITAPGETTVSMNLWGFPRGVMSRLVGRFGEFLATDPPPEKEFEIPGNVKALMDAGELQITVLDTDESWCGLTYREDTPFVLAKINAMIAAGAYPEQLWAGE